MLVLSRSIRREARSCKTSPPLQRMIARAPRWLKQDLLKDGREREQAEDMIAAMIETALQDSQATDHDAPPAMRPYSLDRAEPRLAEVAHLIA
jgi:hypothetical protein